MKTGFASVAAVIVVAGVVLAGCTGGNGQPVSYPNEGFEAPSPVSTIVRTWGESGTVDGVRFTVGAPRLEPPTNDDGSAVGPDPGKHYVAVDLTVENVGKATLESPGFSETTTELGPVDGIMTATTEELPATFLPGDKATSTEYLSVHDKAKELRLETSIGMGVLNTPASAYLQFRGPLPAQGPAPTEAPDEPSDNCTLDPADMDHKTKVECGLVEPATPGCGPECHELAPAAPGPAPVPEPSYDPEGGVQFDENGYPIPGTGNAPGGYNPDTDPAPGPYDSPPNHDPAVPPGEGAMDQFEYGCQQGYIPAEQC